MKGFTKTIAIAALAVVGASVFAQGGSQTVTRRIKIRSADPAFIMMMLNGTQSQLSPEISTILNSGGNGGFGRSGFGGSSGGARGGGWGPFGGGLLGGGNLQGGNSGQLGNQGNRRSGNNRGQGRSGF